MEMNNKITGPACAQYEPLLDDYVEGLLNAQATAEVETHLRNCVNCRNAFDAARDGAHLMQTASFALDRYPGPGPEFPRLVMARVGVEKERRAAERQKFWQPFFTFGWRFAATAMLALMLLLTYAVRGHGRSRQVVGPIGESQQLVDVFAPDPTRTPANQDEVLILLAESDHANH